MPDKTYTEGERRTVASIFFLIFEKMSLEEMRRILGNRIGKTTIARDRNGLAQREAPSEASARAYAAAIDIGDGFDAGDPIALGTVVESVIRARRGFYGSQPLIRHFTSAQHAYPKMMARLDQRIQHRDWEAAIDIIETFREGEVTERYASITPYLEFYLGLAYRNLGEPEPAWDHFKKSFELVRHSNSESDMRSHAAFNYALAIQERPHLRERPEYLDELLRISLDALPKDFPQMLVNVMIVAARLPDGWLGQTAARVRDIIRDPARTFELESLRSMFMEQSELKDLHENGIFKSVIAEIDARSAATKGR